MFTVQGEGQPVPVCVQLDVALLHRLFQGGQRPEDRLHTLNPGGEEGCYGGGLR